MPTPPHTQTPERTQAELLAELRERLGFVSTGPSTAANTGLLTSILRSAHAFVAAELPEQATRRIMSELQCIEGEALYDLHDDRAHEPIHAPSIERVDLHDEPQPPPEQPPLAPPLPPQDEQPALHTLEPLHTAPSHTLHGQPTHWAILGGQLQLWPTPDRRYRLRIVHEAAHEPFTRSDQRCTVPSELVLLQALAVAKSHYRHPDAAIALSAYQSLMSRHKASRHHGVRYFAQPSAHSDSTPPTVRRSASGYQF